VIEAIADPKIKGITCQMTYFSRGTINRLRQGNCLKTHRTRPSSADRPDPW